MSQWAKLMVAILSGRSDQNTSFTSLTGLLHRLGFNMRIRGSHHIFSKTGVDEILNLQPAGDLAKPYQVKQVRQVIVKYKLEISDE